MRLRSIDVAFHALDLKGPNIMHCRRPVLLLSFVAAAACALLAAGCGGGSSPGVAGISSTTTAATTAAQTGPVAFTRCMRSNGVANFPDPPPNGARIRKPTLQQLGVTDSQFKAAASACKSLLPSAGSGPQETAQQKRTRLADELSFARCMRSHGVSRFPDPTAQGDLSIELVQAQGIDVHSPAVLHAVQGCLPASHGALTPAKVRAALDNARR
jgi:hypothetical protein